jgi:hypothetical protein
MTGTPLDAVRYAADVGLSAPAVFPGRPYVVTLNQTVWLNVPTGGGPGLGTPTLVNQQVLGYSGANPNFRQVTKEEIALSGGLLKDQDVVLGPLVFPYNTYNAVTATGATGGIDPLTFSQVANGPSELYFNVQGPNQPSAGENYKKIWDTTDRQVMYRLYLRSVGTE